LEDLASTKHQQQALSEFGYTIDEEFKSDKANFSTRLKQLAKRTGKACAKKTVHQIKLDVCSRSTKTGAIKDKMLKLQSRIFSPK